MLNEPDLQRKGRKVTQSRRRQVLDPLHTLALGGGGDYIGAGLYLRGPIVHSGPAYLLLGFRSRLGLVASFS